MLPEKQQWTPPKVGHYIIISDKLRDVIVHRCKYSLIQRARLPRHQCVYATTLQGADSAENHLERALLAFRLCSLYLT